MKTIKQIADELGVSKQAVHQKRKSAALSTALQPFTSTVDGVIYISVDGEKLLKQAFLKQNKPEPSTDTVNEFTPVDDNKFTPVDGHVDTPEHPLYAILKSELAAKNHQLDEKDRLIEQLRKDLADERQHSRAQADKIAELAKGAQALHAGTMQQLESGERPDQEYQDEVAIDAEVEYLTPDEPQADPEPKDGFWQRCRKAVKILMGED